MIGIILLYRLANLIFAGGGVEKSGESEDVSVPNNIDLMAIPQLCFPGIWFKFCVIKSFAVVLETCSYIISEVLCAKLVILAYVFIYFYNYLFYSPYQVGSK